MSGSVLPAGDGAEGGARCRRAAASRDTTGLENCRGVRRECAIVGRNRLEGVRPCYHTNVRGGQGSSRRLAARPAQKAPLLREAGHAAPGHHTHSPTQRHWGSGGQHNHPRVQRIAGRRADATSKSPTERDQQPHKQVAAVAQRVEPLRFRAERSGFESRLPLKNLCWGGAGWSVLGRGPADCGPRPGPRAVAATGGLRMLHSARVRSSWAGGLCPELDLAREALLQTGDGRQVGPGFAVEQGLNGVL